MNFPTPAIVSQAAVRPLPRALLLLLCLAYVVPGFFGRAPWKTLDITTYGYSMALAQGKTSWLAPNIMGLLPDTEGLLPYWLGAWAIQLFGNWMPSDLASRLTRALEELPAPQREAFLLAEDGGLSLEEIAAATATGRETVKSRLRYAVGKLRHSLQDLL